jgi:hypothetical protein
VDVERTMEFILRAQAKAEGRMAKLDVRMAGITKLLRQGMKMLAKTDANLVQLATAQKRTDLNLAELAAAQKVTGVHLTQLAKTQKELAEAQKTTDRSLKAFIDSLRNGRNGR